MPRKTVVFSSNPDVARIESITQGLVLHELPGYLLRRLDSRAAFLYEKFTGQSDLTPRQFGVLLTLFQSGPLPQTELGNRLHLDRSTLGEMLQRMVERKLVERRAHEKDKRAIEIILTQTGKAALLTVIEHTLEAQKALLSPLPDYLRPAYPSNPCPPLQFPSAVNGRLGRRLPSAATCSNRFVPWV
jgi:MarR family transcriptional regulator, lower aerobic nicotinate degradation pathway regulator